jgi:hypothetical protein
MKEMKIIIKNMLWLFLLAGMAGCSKKNDNYKALIKGGEIHYPGVISNPGYLAGNLRTMVKFNPGPDPKIAKYVIYWNNKQDSLSLAAVSHDPLDTVKVLVPGLKEGTYNFNIYSIDTDGNRSIMTTINSVRVYGPVYLSGLFNRGYNADTPFVVNFATGNVQLKFNAPDSINLKTVVRYIDNAGKTNTAILRPDSNTITLINYKFDTEVTYQSSYIPLRGAIDTFTVASVSAFPHISRVGDITSFFIKNAGNPFYRSDSGTGKWGLPKDWQYNTNVLNQDGGKGGGWSTDWGGVIHFESKDWSGDGVTNGKVYQTITLSAGTYALDIITQGHGGTLNANEVVAAGTSLPDIDNLNSGNTLALYHADQDHIDGTHTLSFTLTQKTTITFGWVVSTQSTTYLQFKQVVLKSL